MNHAIYDLAYGILQWEGEADDLDDAWMQFRADLGYSDDIPGVFERSAYRVETADYFFRADLYRERHLRRLDQSQS